ncbi:ABC transporter permease [Clostridium coskatii]|uniref:Aliphatic sulfonates transport permease protein SsuC n=1 Tax=Clostridium coskatii TaxID=1705578 RepID=A0A162LI76_9CLOT|nr:ABC transporter permease [Clostridium coskatii]OAA93846.1 putative aliphatic sulfonates transport permease protein SsuC [Clostridium coskatii]OBR95174.1 putative aliphatic sulfonates transport permease protein SsuC [Clostridium coskatii]
MEAKGKKNLREKLIRITRKSLAIILFLIFWQVAPIVGIADHQFIPTFSETIGTIWSLTIKNQMLVHVKVSIIRAGIGFILAGIVSVPLGFLLAGGFKKLEEFLDPLLQILAQVNPFSLFPVFILLFGIGEVAKISIIFWVSIWPILFSTITGVKTIDPLLIKAARAMGTSKVKLFWKVILPGAAPSIFSGLKMSSGNAFLMLIAAEMIGASAGLGWLVLNSEVNFQINRLFAAALTIAVLGIAINKAIGFVEKKVVVWKEDSFIS